MNDNKIEFLERSGGALKIRWIGTTTDVNYYDGSKPDTRVVIESWFAFAEPGCAVDT